MAPSSPNSSSFAPALVAASLLVGCGAKPAAPQPAASGTSLAEAASSSLPAASGSAAAPQERLFVDSRKVDCEGGAGPMKCLRVRSSESADWTLFYESVEGFSFEEGFGYELLVERSSVANPPADGSSVRYRLISVVKKSK
jgi:hypothetical protein